MDPTRPSCAGCEYCPSPLTQQQRLRGGSRFL
jgi:hypothetical protein